MQLPEKGPLIVPIACDFRTSQTFEVDFSQLIQTSDIDYISGVFIDNWDNPDPVTLVCTGSNQRVICPANAQMWSPLLAPNPAFVTASNPATGIVVNMQFYNIPLLPMVVRKDGGGGFNLPAGGEVGQVLGLAGVDPYVLTWLDVEPVPPPTGGPWLETDPDGDGYLSVAPTGGDYLVYQP